MHDDRSRLHLGLHSVRIFVEDWCNATRARIGANAWKGLYSVAFLVGLGLFMWGYSLVRATPVVIWTPPPFTHHVAALLAVIAFVFIAAAFIPRKGIKPRLHDPMLLGVKIWARGHLLAKGTLHDIVLFGSFLVWSVLCVSRFVSNSHANKLCVRTVSCKKNRRFFT